MQKKIMLNAKPEFKAANFLTDRTWMQYGIQQFSKIYVKIIMQKSLISGRLCVWKICPTWKAKQTNTFEYYFIVSVLFSFLYKNNVERALVKDWHSAPHFGYFWFDEYQNHHIKLGAQSNISSERKLLNLISENSP